MKFLDEEDEALRAIFKEEEIIAYKDNLKFYMNEAINILPIVESDKIDFIEFISETKEETLNLLTNSYSNIIELNKEDYKFYVLIRNFVNILQYAKAFLNSDELRMFNIQFSKDKLKRIKEFLSC